MKLLRIQDWKKKDISNISTGNDYGLRSSFNRKCNTSCGIRLEKKVLRGWDLL
jgi:hypothetical protein